MTATDFTSLVDDSVRDELLEDLQGKFPGIPQDAAEAMTRIVLGLRLAFPAADEAKAIGYACKLVEMECEAGEQWARNCAAFYRSQYRTTYDKAIAAGLHPAKYLVAEHGQMVDLSTAKKLVKEFKAEDKAQAEAIPNRVGAEASTSDSDDSTPEAPEDAENVYA
jgi:hypothetical protein